MRLTVEAMVPVFLHYCNNLFTSCNPSGFEKVLDKIDRRLRDDVRSGLDQSFKCFEVDVAIHQISHFKSPCPDGLNSGFYQHYWNFIGE